MTYSQHVLVLYVILPHLNVPYFWLNVLISSIFLHDGEKHVLLDELSLVYVLLLLLHEQLVNDESFALHHHDECFSLDHLLSGNHHLCVIFHF